MSGVTDTEGRTLWVSHDLGIDNEPLILSLIKYRQRKNRRPIREGETPNLVCSLTSDGKQKAIIDLDFDFWVAPSSTPGHSHLYLNTPISKIRWVALMVALRLAKAVEPGYFVWSLRRGANFVRLPGVAKAPGRESTYPEYGWFFKLRRQA